MNKEIRRILVANRGDSAVRIIRACKELNIETVSVYSRVDRDALHTRLSDISVCIGDKTSKDSYLNSYNIITVAMEYKVDAIHPGIGFFAENPDFCELCESCGFIFIGPSCESLRVMGNKVLAKQIANECNVPVIGDKEIECNSYEDMIEHIENLFYPLILKASNGGGGKGIRVVRNDKQLLSAFEECRKEADKIFGHGSILIEPYIEKARHIEVQVLSEFSGKTIILGYRECSIQRGNQKLIEETNSSVVTEDLKEKLYEYSRLICKKIGYLGAGTIEYILDKDSNVYFLEMNTRLQVEHTITELVTGIDIVKQQIKIAMGIPLEIENDINNLGYAIQCRINSEYFDNGKYVPDVGIITRFDIPGGFGVRVDSSYEVGNKVTPFYDPLLCKLCCVSTNKENAVKIMIRALDEFRIEGVRTNKELLLKILKSEDFISGNYNCNYLEEYLRDADKVKY